MGKEKSKAVRSVKRNLVPLYLMAVLLGHGLNTPLTQSQITRHLEDDHGLTLDRHALIRNLRELKHLCDVGTFPGLFIECDAHSGSRNRWSIIRESEFDPSEIRFLVDAVLAFPNVSDKHRNMLVGKLGSLSKSHDVLPRAIQPMDAFFPNKQLFSTVDLLDSAIQENRIVSFYMNAYGPDKKLYPGDEPNVVRPYQLLMQNGRYYLLARYVDPYLGYEEKNYHFRVDLITDVEVGDPVDKKDKALWPKGLVGSSFNVAKYRIEQPLLWSDKLEDIRFRIDVKRCTWAVDLFGSAVEFGKEQGGFVEATVRSSPTAMLQWAIAHPKEIEVLEPVHLREEIREKAQEVLKIYK